MASAVAKDRPKAVPQPPEAATGMVCEIVEAVAAVVVGSATRLMTYHKPVGNPAIGNPHGAIPKGPSHGAAGIAGLRADIGDGSLSIRDLERMTIRQLQDRYRVCHSYAVTMRRKVLAYGLGGRCRLPGGRPRDVPLPRLGPVTDTTR